MKYLRSFLLLAVCLTGCNSNQVEIVRGKEFVKIDPKEITGNPAQLIGDEWMLITAGNKSV
jgi:hypothetical protein